MMSDYYLPEEVIIIILSRLSVKNLVAYSCVCKSWRRIITDPAFMTNHVSTSRSNNNKGENQKLLLLKHYPKYTEPANVADSINLVDYLDWPYTDLRRFLLSKRKEDGPYKGFRLDFDHEIHGCCNGLILLSNYHSKRYDSKFFILNPSLGGRNFIPLPPFDVRGLYLAGIGFDSISNDYKVLVFSWTRGMKEDSLIGLYSLKTNSWKDISDRSQYSRVVHGPSPKMVFMNGALHWTAASNLNNTSDNDLISRFDLTHEVFDTICFPHFITNKHGQALLDIATVSGKLCFADLSNSGRIWIMNEYGVAESWTILCRLPGPVVPPRLPFLLHVLGSRANGELLLTCCHWTIFSFDPKSNQLKYLGIRYSFYLDNYVESLVLFGSIDTPRIHSTSNPSPRPIRRKKREWLSSYMKKCRESLMAETDDAITILCGCPVHLPQDGSRLASYR